MFSRTQPEILIIHVAAPLVTVLGPGPFLASGLVMPTGAHCTLR